MEHVHPVRCLFTLPYICKHCCKPFLLMSDDMCFVLLDRLEIVYFLILLRVSVKGLLIFKDFSCFIKSSPIKDLL